MLTYILQWDIYFSALAIWIVIPMWFIFCVSVFCCFADNCVCVDTFLSCSHFHYYFTRKIHWMHILHIEGHSHIQHEIVINWFMLEVLEKRKVSFALYISIARFNVELKKNNTETTTTYNEIQFELYLIECSETFVRSLAYTEQTLGEWKKTQPFLLKSRIRLNSSSNKILVHFNASLSRKNSCVRSFIRTFSLSLYVYLLHKQFFPIQ